LSLEAVLGRVLDQLPEGRAAVRESDSGEWHLLAVDDMDDAGGHCR
jgi:hypothetical protein